MRYISAIILILFSLSVGGCATWKGVKQDSKDAYKWSKDKVHDGAEYVEEKTR